MLLLRRSAQAVASQGKEPDAGEVKILLKQLAKAGKAFRRGNVWSQRLDTLRTDVGDKRARVLSGGRARNLRRQDQHHGERTRRQKASALCRARSASTGRGGG